MRNRLSCKAKGKRQKSKGKRERRRFPTFGFCLLPFAFCLAASLSAQRLKVAADGSGDTKTVQSAIDNAPATGATIEIAPGLYYERLHIEKPNIILRGLGKSPADTILSYDLNASKAGGTTKSASVTVTGDGFQAENLTIENTFSRTHGMSNEGGQAVAIKVMSDRAVFRRVRFLGYQDTLYADGKGCDSEQGPCRPARQYFVDCYIEGNVDFIFGDAIAFFENCELHGLAHSQVMLTAQSKRYDGEQSGYVFDHCHVTAEPGADHIWLGRPWRSHASVVFMNTELPVQINPAGWSEWLHNDQPSLPTVFYAEYRSTGPGAKPEARDPHAHQLTAAEAAKFAAKVWLAGADNWNPTEKAK
jgi:pectin methylesterase-like acyl-CoA thioesterase